MLGGCLPNLVKVVYQGYKDSLYISWKATMNLKVFTKKSCIQTLSEMSTTDYYQRFLNSIWYVYKKDFKE